MLLCLCVCVCTSLGVNNYVFDCTLPYVCFKFTLNACKLITKTVKFCVNNMFKDFIMCKFSRLFCVRNRQIKSCICKIKIFTK